MMHLHYTIRVLFTEMPKIHSFAASIWCGDKKPSNLDFLNPFVAELDDLIKRGLIINSHQVSVSVRCFIYDTPARAMIKGNNALEYFKKTMI